MTVKRLSMTILALSEEGWKMHKMSIRNVGDPGFVSRQVTQARRFYFGRIEGPTGGGLQVAGGGWELAAEDYLINRDTFPWLSIEFVAGGRGRLAMEAAGYDLRRGVVFAYGPGVPHRIETSAGAPLSKYFLNFSGREAADLLAAAMLEPGTCKTLGNPDEIEAAFEAMVVEGVADRPQAAAVAAYQLRILFLKMTDAEDADEPTDRRARQTFNRCVDYMDENFLEIRTVEDVAAACHLSVGHLTRLFTRFGYGAPYRYLTRKKMLHAAALLDSGALLVGEVADKLGVDPFQFSRVFKRVHGISPSDFARRHGTGALAAGS